MLICLVFLIVFEQCLFAYSENPYDRGSVYVDVITRRYLDLEMALWKEIEQDQEGQNDILQKIHAEHLKFYSRPFIATKGSTEAMTAPMVKFFKSDISTADLEASVVKNYLQMPLNSSLDENIIEMSQFYANTTLLDRIHETSFEKDYFGFLKEIIDAENCSTINATTIESTADVIMKQYEIIAKAKLKAYTLPQISYMFLTLYNIENKISEANYLRKRFNEQTKMLQRRVRELLRSADRDIWMCDMPPDFYGRNAKSNGNQIIEDLPRPNNEKDNQITHLLDGYVDNEVNLNNNDDCTQTCSDYKVTRNYGCYKGTYCEKEEQSFARCNGTVFDCRFIESDLEICSASPSKERRFESIIYSSGKTFGNPNLCHQPKIKLTSWARWFVRCSNCFCFCDEPSEKSDRYFSLQPALSDTNQNKIITGVALRKVNRIFFWGITQSTLLNNGQLNQTRYYFNSWKRIKEFSISDPGITDGIDYHTLSWQNRSVNLDTLVAPPGYVLTGIRFNLVDGHLNLAIRVTRFDFKSGRLFDNFEWISNYESNRTPILLDQPYESHHNSKTKSVPDTSRNRYIEFQPSDIEKDGGQTTIPFIDVQLVQPPNDKPSLLSGAGIYYKGETGFGGFIAPNVITYDYSHHIG